MFILLVEAAREGTEFGVGSLESELVIDEGETTPTEPDTNMEDSSAVAALMGDNQHVTMETDSLSQYQPTEGAYKIASSTTEFNFGVEEANTPASVASISESDRIAKRMEEVIDAVSKGDFSSEPGLLLDDNIPATPQPVARGGGRKRKTTTSSIDSAAGVLPNKRQALSSIEAANTDLEMTRSTVIETSHGLLYLIVCTHTLHHWGYKI